MKQVSQPSIHPRYTDMMTPVDEVGEMVYRLMKTDSEMRKVVPPIPQYELMKNTPIFIAICMTVKLALEEDRKIRCQ